MNRMRKIFLILAVLIGVVANAQQGKIKTTVVNTQQVAVENATVELLRSKDSSIVKLSLSDKTGLAEFENIKFGEYLLRVTVVNYATYFSSSFSLSTEQTDVTVPKIALQQKATQLSGVTVTAKKPFIQKLSDRIVVNVENSIVSAGSSAMDVL